MLYKTFNSSLIAVLATLAFIATPALAQSPLPIFPWAGKCNLDGVGGDLEPGDNPAVLPSVFTITCTVGGNAVTINKFFVNRQGISPAGALLPGHAPNADILNIEISLFVDGTLFYRGTAPATAWPIPSTSFTPAFLGITIPAGKTFKVEIRPTIFPGPGGTIPPTPTGGLFCTSVLLEGSEAGKGGKTGFLDDPKCENIEKDFKVVTLTAPTVAPIPASNLNPGNTKVIHAFAGVSLTIKDDVTTPELNTTGIIFSNASVTMTLTSTGTFVAGCVALVDLVDPSTGLSLIGGPQNAKTLPASLTFGIPAGLLIPGFIPDGGSSTLALSPIGVVITLAATPMPAGCDQSTIGVNVAITVKFDATENVKQMFGQTVTANDPVADNIFDSGFEKTEFGDWSFEFLRDQKPLPHVTLGPSVIGEIKLTATDEDCSNTDPVVIQAVEVTNVAPDPVVIQAVEVTNVAPTACTAPGDIVNIQIRDGNGNILGASSSFGVIPLTPPVIVPDGNMGTPQSVTLEVVVTTADNPPPNPKCQLELQVKLLGFEGGNLFDGKAGRRSLDKPQGVTSATVSDLAQTETVNVAIGSLTLKLATPTGNLVISVLRPTPPGGPASYVEKLNGTMLCTSGITITIGQTTFTIPVSALFTIAGGVAVGNNVNVPLVNVMLPSPARTISIPVNLNAAAAINAALAGVVPGLTFDLLQKFGTIVVNCSFPTAPVLTDIFGRPVPNVKTTPGTITDPLDSEQPPPPPLPETVVLSIGSLTLTQGSTGAVDISINAAVVAQLRGTVVLADPSGKADAQSIFEVTEISSADPRRYSLSSVRIRQVDLNKDGVLETLIEFELTLLPGTTPAAGTLLKLEGKATSPGLLTVTFAQAKVLGLGGKEIPVTVRAGSIQVKEGTQPG